MYAHTGSLRDFPSCHWVRGRLHPRQVTRSSQGWQKSQHLDKLSITPTSSLKSPINLTCMYLDCGWKQDRTFQEGTHTDTGRTCKLEFWLEWMLFSCCPSLIKYEPNKRAVLPLPLMNVRIMHTTPWLGWSVCDEECCGAVMPSKITVKVMTPWNPIRPLWAINNCPPPLIIPTIHHHLTENLRSQSRSRTVIFCIEFKSKFK